MPCGQVVVGHGIEQPVDVPASNLQTGQEQDVILACLRDAPTWLRPPGQYVAVKQQHRFKVVGQDTGGPQARNTSTEDDGGARLSVGLCRHGCLLGYEDTV
jgi:hypothetical protein